MYICRYRCWNSNLNNEGFLGFMLWFHEDFHVSIIDKRSGKIDWYRWLFLRKEQISLPKLTSENLKSIVSLTILVKSQWYRIFSDQKSVPRQSKGKFSLWNWFDSEISRYKNFWMWVWGLVFVPFSEKVTCMKREGGWSIIDF